MYGLQPRNVCMLAVSDFRSVRLYIVNRRPITVPSTHGMESLTCPTCRKPPFHRMRQNRTQERTTHLGQGSAQASSMPAGGEITARTGPLLQMLLERTRVMQRHRTMPLSNLKMLIPASACLSSRVPFRMFLTMVQSTLRPSTFLSPAQVRHPNTALDQSNLRKGRIICLPSSLWTPLPHHHLTTNPLPT
jgi:hypothetical protein